MTNMPVDAPIASAIKHRMRRLGVSHPHVFGREFLTRIIRSSARLRALVPRVYGLGDLSIILDERRAEQTRALLGHMLPTLKVYVPTKPHVKAVRALSDHGIALLLGDPGTGKSSIAALLATIAADDPRQRCYKADGPEELIENWNPNEPGGFYWIDDAFGPNQLREDYVDRWIALMPKIQAAITGGNRFVLTSRRHIYEAAKVKLGSRNHPLFRDEQAIVYVGQLDLEERKQILYNHIKLGHQLRTWKGRIKYHLDAIAEQHSLLPEIARRLAEPAYTTNISPTRSSVLRFVRDPHEYLLQTIRELSKQHRAALTLVFLHRGHMPVGSPNTAMKDLVLTHFDIDGETLGNSISQMRDSFLVQMSETGHPTWIFKHPTIADALAAILGETEGMGELYLRGVDHETVLTQVVCASANHIEGAVVISDSLEDVLVERLLDVPDERYLNWLFFSFLTQRASETVFRKVLAASPGILSRGSFASQPVGSDPAILAYGRAHQLGLLPDRLRDEAAVRLNTALFDNVDATFLDDDVILALIPPRTLLTLTARLRRDLLEDIATRANVIVESEKYVEAQESFAKLVTLLDKCDDLFADEESVKDMLFDARVVVNNGIRQIERERDENEESDESDEYWDGIARSEESGLLRAAGTTGTGRSIFSDLDE